MRGGTKAPGKRQSTPAMQPRQVCSIPTRGVTVEGRVPVAAVLGTVHACLHRACCKASGKFTLHLPALPRATHSLRARCFSPAPAGPPSAAPPAAWTQFGTHVFSQQARVGRLLGSASFALWSLCPKAHGASTGRRARSLVLSLMGGPT